MAAIEEEPEEESDSSQNVLFLVSLIANIFMAYLFYKAHRYLFTNPMGIETQQCIHLLNSNYQLSEIAYKVATVGIVRDVLQLLTATIFEPTNELKQMQ